MLDKFDRNRDGAVSKAELTHALNSIGGNFTQQEIDTIFSAADSNGNG